MSASDDYLNASWISDPSSTRKWIASQAPLPETTFDFLSLFFPDPGAGATPPPRVVLMLTACNESGRPKSARYWPEKVGDSIEIPSHSGSYQSSAFRRQAVPSTQQPAGLPYPIQVSYLESISSSSSQDEAHQKGWLTNRLLLSTTIDEERKEVEIHHVEYFGWQDHGVPSSPSEVLRLLAHVNSLVKPEEPVVVHCSAGVGRTGTFIALAWLLPCLEQLFKADTSAFELLRRNAEMSPLGPFIVSVIQPQIKHALLPSLLRNCQNLNRSDQEVFDPVMATIDHLRDQRTTMVQTVGQVMYVYTCCRIWWEGKEK